MLGKELAWQLTHEFDTMDVRVMDTDIVDSDEVTLYIEWRARINGERYIGYADVYPQSGSIILKDWEVEEDTTQD